MDAFMMTGGARVRKHPVLLAFLRCAIAAIWTGVVAASAVGATYPWPTAETQPETLLTRLAPPPGFDRAAVSDGSFAAWLRALPVKPNGAPVKLFNGQNKPRQDVHAAVIDIDVGSKDLQQCADAVMRLRAEWQFSAGKKSEIAFNFTSGTRVPFSRYAKGERPEESGKKWTSSAKADDGYAAFRTYMNLIFAYAGTASLEKELKSVDVTDIQIGDVFIKGGFPGHAVIVADIAMNTLTKAKRFLLIQSYMPAQDMHVLKNPANGDGSPWYAVPTGELITPEWTFAKGSLRRWP
jgi:Domain of unknown function (4846)